MKSAVKIDGVTIYPSIHEVVGRWLSDYELSKNKPEAIFVHSEVQMHIDYLINANDIILEFLRAGGMIEEEDNRKIYDTLMGLKVIRDDLSKFLPQSNWED